jgi:hypothetical protein
VLCWSEGIPKSKICEEIAIRRWAGVDSRMGRPVRNTLNWTIIREPELPFANSRNSWLGRNTCHLLQAIWSLMRNAGAILRLLNLS